MLSTGMEQVALEQEPGVWLCFFCCFYGLGQSLALCCASALQQNGIVTPSYLAQNYSKMKLKFGELLASEAWSSYEKYSCGLALLTIPAS